MQHPKSRKTEVLSLLGAIFALTAAVIWVRTATVKETYRYFQKEKELRKVEQELKTLRVTWLQITSPKTLETLATALELVPPEMDQIVRYDSRKGPKNGP